MSADTTHLYFPKPSDDISIGHMGLALIAELDHDLSLTEANERIERYFNAMGEDSPMRKVDGLPVVPRDAAEDAMRQLVAEEKAQDHSTPAPDEAPQSAPTKKPSPKDLRNRLLAKLGDKNDEANSLKAEIARAQAKLRRVHDEIEGLRKKVEALSPGLFDAQPKAPKHKKTERTATPKTDARPLTNMEIAALKATVGCPMRLCLLEDYLGGTLALLPRHTASEIRKNCPGIGPKTIARINEGLAEIGLKLVEG